MDSATRAVLKGCCGRHGLTLRAMKENARQGFWNGALPPIGYRVVEAERRGAKVKKTLAIDPMHADTVRLIDRLALSGDGTTGPMGIKAIVGYLNDRRIFTRDGGRWGVGQIHAILTRTTYVGQHRFNRRGKDNTRKADDEVITVVVPPLIDQATFDVVQTLLRDRNPKTLAPHLISSPNMLTGLLHCAQCGGLMTMRTGKAGRYRYYACQKTARTDTARCTGIAIPIDALDTLVARYMMERLLDRKRVEDILTMILERRQALKVRDGADRLDELNRRAEEAMLRLKRLRKAIEIGALDLEDPSLQERLTSLRSLQARTAEETATLQAKLDRASTVTVSVSLLSTVIETAGQHLLERGDGFRRGYASAFAARIVAEAGKAPRCPCVSSARLHNRGTEVRASREYTSWVEEVRHRLELLSRLVVRLTPSEATEFLNWRFELCHDKEWDHWWLYEPLSHLLDRALSAIPRSSHSSLALSILDLPLLTKKKAKGIERDWPELGEKLIAVAEHIERPSTLWDARVAQLIQAARGTHRQDRTRALVRLLALTRAGTLTERERELLDSAIWAIPSSSGRLPGGTDLLPHVWLELSDEPAIHDAFRHDVIDQLRTADLIEQRMVSLVAIEEDQNMAPEVRPDAQTAYEIACRLV